MGLIERLRGATVALDSSPIIYFFEKHPRYLPLVRPIFQGLDAGTLTAVTSIVSLVEVLTYPLRKRDTELVKRYREFFSGAVPLTTYPVTAAIAEIAAELRANYGTKTPDAIHLATARHAGASFFLTNDDRLPSLPGLEALVLEELVAQQAGTQRDETSPAS